MITNKLLSSGLKQTFQRRKILEFLLSSKAHPTAAEIYKTISKEIPTISKTTVYNTVNALAKEGIIKRIKTETSQTRFDACVFPHYHFHCLKCGKVYDIEKFKGETLKDKVKGHKVKDVFVCFSGLCKTCLSAKH